MLALPCWGQVQGASNGANTAANFLPPRRLSDAAKAALTACLKKSPGEFSIAAIADDREAYRYAQDWREVFVRAGWRAANGDTLIASFTIAGGKWTGMRVSMRGDPQKGEAPGEASPEATFARCVEARRDIPSGGRILRYKDRPGGSVDIQVSAEPQR